MAYRRSALDAVGGFDERFPAGVPGGRRAGLPGPRGPAGRCAAATRAVTHPVRPESRWVSVRTQRGNADDALLRRLYGPRWRDRSWTSRPAAAPGTWRSPPPALAVGAWPPRPPAPPAGRRRRAGAAWAGRHRRVRRRPDRARPADRARGQPPCSLTSARDPAGGRPSTGCAAGGAGAAPAARAGPLRRVPAGEPGALRRRPVRPGRHADRATCPYNGDPALVEPCRAPGRRWTGCAPPGCGSAWSPTSPGWPAAGSPPTQLAAVNARVEELLGPFDTWQVCPHDDDAGCALPQTGARPGRWPPPPRSAPRPRRCVVVGDIGRDMAAAGAAGATGILVPTPVTRPDEVAAAPAVAADLRAAVDLILRRQRAGRSRRRGPGRGRHACWSPAPTRPATCCSPGRRSGPSRPAPTGWCCSAGRAGGPPPSCCPASTRSSSGGCRGSTRSPDRSTRPTSTR